MTARWLRHRRRRHVPPRGRITGSRNFEFRSRDDFTVHYEDREFLLSDRASVDF